MRQQETSLAIASAVVAMLTPLALAQHEILYQPQDLVVQAGQSARFEFDRSIVDFDCFNDIVQWYRDGAPYSSGDSDSSSCWLDIPAASPADAGTYHLELTLFCNTDPNSPTLVSLPARLTVIDAPISDLDLAFTIPLSASPVDVALLRRPDVPGRPVVAAATTADAIEVKEVKGVTIARPRAIHPLNSVPRSIRADRGTDALIAAPGGAYELSLDANGEYEPLLYTTLEYGDWLQLRSLDARVLIPAAGFPIEFTVLGDGGGSGCDFPGYADSTYASAQVPSVSSHIAVDFTPDGANLPPEFRLDFNRDQFHFFVADLSNGQVVFFEDQGYALDANSCSWEHAGWLQTSTLQRPGTIGDLAVFDTNSDGASELLLSRPDSDRIEIFARTADPNQPTELTLLSDPNVGAAPQRIVTGDWNGDGIGDLAVTNHLGDSVSVLEGDGLGGFSKQRIMLPPGAHPLGIDAGDMDGDGWPDLAVACSGTNEVAIILNAGRYALCDVVTDCNGNGIDDTCDLDPADPDGDGHVATDTNQNGLLDECECFADVDGSGVVDLTDLAIVLANFDQVGPNIPGDVDSDGDVDLTDLAVVLGQFDRVCG